MSIPDRPLRESLNHRDASGTCPPSAPKGRTKMGALRPPHGLFDEPLPRNRSRSYEFLRLGDKGGDITLPSEQARFHCEELWADFWPFADANFKAEFASQTHARWFEMYLTVSLLRAGHDIRRRSQPAGPDVLIEANDRRIWLEATCAEAGEPGKPDSIPEPVYGRLVREPAEQIALRIRNALDGKQRKFQQYVQHGIVRPDDLAVIAINVDRVDGPGPYICNHFCRSLYSGFGPPMVRFPGSGSDERDEYFGDFPDDFVKKNKSGAKVSMRPFLDGSMAHVTAVLGSESNMLNLPSYFGGDFTLYPNLASENQWPAHSLNVGRELTFDQTEDRNWEGFLDKPSAAG